MWISNDEEQMPFPRVEHLFSNISWAGDPIFPGHLSKPHCVRSCFPSGHRLSVLDDLRHDKLGSQSRNSCVFCGTFFFALDLWSCNIASVYLYICFMLTRHGIAWILTSPFETPIQSEKQQLQELNLLGLLICRETRETPVQAETETYPKFTSTNFWGASSAMASPIASAYLIAIPATWCTLQ